MKKSLKITIPIVVILAGCASQPPGKFDYNNAAIVPSKESRSHPEYHAHLNECHRYATSNQSGVGTNAVVGAAAGAGLASLFGLALGLDSGYGKLAGVSALSGGLAGAAGAANSNDAKYKQVMVQCMRDKGHHVY